MIIQVPEKLLPIFTTNDRYICIDGGRGSGKSWSVADFLISKGLEKKRRIMCTREVQNSIKDSVHKLISDRIYAHKIESKYIITDKSIRGKNGTEFIFKGLWRNEQDIKSTEGIDLCWVEEAQSISKRSLNTLIPTIRQENSQVLFTYNPINENDPVHTEFKTSDRKNVLRITVNYYDNPFFPDVLKNEMEYDRRTNQDKYYHIWEGNPLKHSYAQVFYNKWIVEEFKTDEGTFFYQGADWGFSNDPCVFIQCFVKDRTLYINQEAYKVGVQLDAIPAFFSAVKDSKDYPCRGDKSRPDTIDYVQRRGYPLLSSARGGPGSIQDGIEKIKGFEKIVIHPRCKHTIDEFRLYSYKVDKLTDEISTKLEDKNNHCIDSLRYALEPLYGFEFVAIGPNGVL